MELSDLRGQTLYCLGPMTGLPDFNYPLFNKTARHLRERGARVLNPAENFGGSTDHPEGRKAFMREAFIRLMQCSGVVLLPGWEKSAGARAEVLVANELDIPTYRFNKYGRLYLVDASVHTAGYEDGGDV